MTMYVRKPLAQANRKIQFYAEFSIIFALKGVYGIRWGEGGGGKGFPLNFQFKECSLKPAFPLLRHRGNDIVPSPQSSTLLLM